MCRKYSRATLSTTVEISSSGPDASRRFASRKYSATSSSNFTRLSSSQIGVANRSRSNARIVSLRVGMKTSQDYFWSFDLGRLILKVVKRPVFPSPINNGRFFQDAG
jgi:hypothetical protein